MVSQKLINAVKLHDGPAYEIAKKVGIHQSKISQFLNNIIPVEKGDSRVIAIGKIVGVSPDDCFE